MNLQLACKLLTSSVITASINANDDNMQHQRKLSSLKDDVGSGCANHVDFHASFLTTAGEKCNSCTVCPHNHVNQIFAPKAKDACIECSDEKDSCNTFEMVTVFDEEWSMKVVTLKATDMDASHNPESVKFLGSNDGNDWDELLTAKLHFNESNDTIQFLFDNEKAYTNYAMQLSGLKTKTYVGKYGIIESYAKACTAQLHQEITGVSIPYYTTMAPTNLPSNAPSDTQGYEFNNNEELKRFVAFWQANEQYASSQYGEINDWDVSRITNMAYMFSNAHAFNSNISDWNTSSVTRMDWMFNNAYAFNSNISDWNTSKVREMDYMFSNAKAFNSNISDWNTSKVTEMGGMFYEARAFNSNISDWNTSKVKTMNEMFSNAKAFNSNILDWNTSSVTRMNNMFYNAEAFDQVLCWDVSKANKGDMFTNAHEGAGLSPNYPKC